MLTALLTRCQARGWSASVDAHRTGGFTAYVHAHRQTFIAEGPTPELALSNAEAKAIAACALEAAA